MNDRPKPSEIALRTTQKASTEFQFIDARPGLSEEDKKNLKDLYLSTQRNACERLLIAMRIEELKLRQALGEPKPVKFPSDVPNATRFHPGALSIYVAPRERTLTRQPATPNS